MARAATATGDRAPKGGPRARRSALRQLLLGGVSGTQEELRDHLAEAGFQTTQSTISRDLKLLGAKRRLRDDGDFVYVLEAPPRAPGFPADMVVRVDHNESMVVVRTRTGRAPAVGLELDALDRPDILGTIAGDDTVLVIPQTVRKTADLARTLRRLAHLDPAGT